MRLNRVHVEVPVGGRVHVDLDGTAANHVARVLRLRTGDALILFDNAGGEYAATVVACGARKACASRWASTARSTASRRCGSRWHRASRAANAWTWWCRRPPSWACGASSRY